MLGLFSKDMTFFELFEGIADRLVTAAEHLHTLARKFPDVDELIQAIRKAEHESDDLAHSALDRLDRAFITPFDREDIHMLVGEMDDIIDAIDALVKRVPLFHVQHMEEYFIRQTDVLLNATRAVREAVHKLRKTCKMAQLRDTLIEIHAHESAGDDNHHAAMSHLFSGALSPLEVIKWKELFDYIEEAIDGCEDVGNVLERIVLKGG